MTLGGYARPQSLSPRFVRLVCRSRSGYSRQRCASVSSRIRPANDRETSRNVGNGWSTESAGQEPDSAIGAGSESGPENTGFESRWDYKRKAPGQGAGPESSGSLNRDSKAEYPENIPSQIVRSKS